MQLYFINFKFNHNYKHDDNLNIEHYLLTFSKLIIKLKYTMLVESQLKLDKGRSHSKKKSVKFHTWGGESGQNWVIFTLFLFFFFHVLNHANLQRKFFSV